ncbi:inositol monophosphatase [Candidatus Micrarchaeota archaeon]|nr:inositol monophosphatase [Candidatus Micrarchaeota archaeon]
MTKFLDVALEAAKTAGEIIESQYGRNVRADRKPNGEEVTKTDHAAENAIREVLSRRFPDHGFWGEETGRRDGEKYTWIVDPIDGTTNFIRGIPYFATSIALGQNGKTVLGVVSNPVTDELFYAESSGAFLNKKRLRVRPSQTLDVVCLEICTRSLEGFTKNRQWMNALLDRHMSLKSLGSCALSACFVAASRADASFDYRVNPYDIAAGAHIAKQAGAIVTQANGKPIDTTMEKTSFIIASSRSIHRQIQDVRP